MSQTGTAAIGIRRHFTSPGVHPYDEVVWERRDARITNWQTAPSPSSSSGVEFPASWSLNATNIVAQKYFRGTLGTPERESSLRQVVDRVVDTITRWGVEGGYFVDDAEADAVPRRAEVPPRHPATPRSTPGVVQHRRAGRARSRRRRASSCRSTTTMDSILNWYREEGIIFKGGSGAGVNLSKIRSSSTSC